MQMVDIGVCHLLSMKLSTWPLEPAYIRGFMKTMVVLCPRLHNNYSATLLQAAECKGAWGATAGR